MVNERRSLLAHVPEVDNVLLALLDPLRPDIAGHPRKDRNLLGPLPLPDRQATQHGQAQTIFDLLFRVFKRFEQSRAGRDGKGRMIDCVERQIQRLEMCVCCLYLRDVVRGEAVQPFLRCYKRRSGGCVLCEAGRQVVETRQRTLIDQYLTIPYALRDRLLRESDR